MKPSARYGSVESLLKRFFRALPYSPEIRTQLLLGGLTPAEKGVPLSPAVRAASEHDNPYEELTAGVAELRDLEPLDRLIYQHCKFYLADQNLVAVDRASMACGLEVRAPFLDRSLVELAGRIPSTLKMNGWRTKYILKRALRGRRHNAPARRRTPVGRSGQPENPVGLVDIRRLAGVLPAGRALELSRCPLNTRPHGWLRRLV